MKNKIKKLLASVIAFVVATGLVIGGATPVNASSVKNETNHTYNVYQIFTGTQSATTGDTKLGDVVWGSAVSTSANQTAFLTKIKNDDRFKLSGTNVFSAASTASDVASILSDHNDLAEAFANVAADYVRENSITAYAIVNQNATTPDLTAGYYLFVDTHTAGTGEALNSALLQVTNSSEGLTIEEKYTVPTPTKTIEDVQPQTTNDDSSTAGTVLHESDTTTEKDSAVAEIGDIVTFHLSAKLPSNLEDYDTYKFEFVDTLSSGLEYVSDQTPTVKIGDDQVTTGFSTIVPSSTNGNKLTITWENIKSDTHAAKDKVVSVEYTAKVTNAAVTGTAGNSNSVVLNYSNNPNGEGEGSSTSKEVKVYTFKLNVVKHDDNNSGLAGAGFVLKNNAGNYYSYDVTNNIVKWVDNVESATQLYSHNDGKLYASASEDDKDKREFTGLAEGSYTLQEKTVPSGYNKADDISFTIDANATSENDNITLITPNEPITLDESGDYNVTVTNTSGKILPSTGGIGTTVFYIAGGILIIGAAALLINRKKRENA